MSATLPGVETYFANLAHAEATYEAKRAQQAHEAQLDEINAELERLDNWHRELEDAIDRGRDALDEAGIDSALLDTAFERIIAKAAGISARIDCVRDALASPECA